jgi:hypothetical protein
MGSIATSILLLVLLLLFASCTAKTQPEGTPSGPVHPDELAEKLADRRLLRRLGVSRIILLETDAYRVTIGAPGDTDPIGEMYYTIQDGWHFKAENERMEFVTGEGWIIAEQ